MTLVVGALVLVGCAGLTVSVVAVASSMDARKKVHAGAFGLVAGTLPLLVAAAVAIPEELGLRAAFVAVVSLATTPVAAQALLRLSHKGEVDREVEARSSSRHDGHRDRVSEKDDETEGYQG